MKRTLALFLTVCIALSSAGCAVQQSEPPINLSDGADVILSQPSEGSSQPPYVSEFPSASSEVSLPESSSQTESSSSSVSSKSSSSSSQAAISSRPSSSLSSSEEDEDDDSAEVISPSVTGEIRAVWFSYLDLSGMLKGKTASQFKASITAAFGQVADAGFNTVFVHVRPFADALYDSSYFPWSYMVNGSGTEGKDPGYDPLNIMVSAAHQKGLEIEAWINPYRVRGASSSVALSSGSIIRQWQDEEEDYVIEYKNALYLNPGREEVQQLIVDGVAEIVENYAVDGIHFDDYFYPAPDESFDSRAYADYRQGGGGKSLANWRRSNVDDLVRSVYSTIKSIDSSVRFGISPQGNMDNNYSGQYIDVEKWVTNKGYVDYICPQIYFGFDNSTLPFEETVQEWNELIGTSGVKLYVGLAAYKVGAEDTWAGNGKYEWQNNSNLLARMVKTSRRCSRYKGFAMYAYNSLFTPSSSVKAQVNKELANLKDIMN